MVEGIRVRACLRVDAKSIYGCLAQQVLMQSLAEELTALELMGFERCIEETGLIGRWCHSEVNLSDNLSKAAAYGPIELRARAGCWRFSTMKRSSAPRSGRRDLTRFESNNDLARRIRDAFESAYISLPDAADGGENDNDRGQVCNGPPGRG